MTPKVLDLARHAGNRFGAADELADGVHRGRINVGRVLVRAPARHDIPVSYVTTGQRVPEDIEDATESRLLSLAGARIVRGEAA